MHACALFLTENPSNFFVDCMQCNNIYIFKYGLMMQIL